MRLFDHFASPYASSDNGRDGDLPQKLKKEKKTAQQSQHCNECEVAPSIYFELSRAEQKKGKREGGLCIIHSSDKMCI